MTTPGTLDSQLTMPRPNRQRIGFVSTRVRGTDGVSLEIHKWAGVLERLGYDCYYVTGASDCPPERTYLIEGADFQHPVIEEINALAFGHHTRAKALSRKLRELSRHIKKQLYDAIHTFQLDVIIAQNALTIPMNIPLGAALVEVLIEQGMPCIAHHHDFVWERERFLINENYRLARRHFSFERLEYELRSILDAVANPG